MYCISNFGSQVQQSVLKSPLGEGRFIEMEGRMVVARSWAGRIGRGMGGYCLMKMELHFCKNNNTWWIDGSDGCKIMQINLMPLNCMRKNSSNKRFYVVYILLQFKNKYFFVCLKKKSMLDDSDWRTLKFVEDFSRSWGLTIHSFISTLNHHHSLCLMY